MGLTRRLAVLLALAVGLGALPTASATAQSQAPCRPSPFTPALAASLRQRYPGRRFTASVLDLRDGCAYELFPRMRITTASVFKIEVLAAVLLRAQRAGRGLTASEAALVRPMISRSANPPTNELFTSLGGVAGFRTLHRTFGLAETVTPTGTWGLTETTARDQIHLLHQLLVGGGPITEAGRTRATQEMRGVVPAQRWGITERAPAGWPVALKNGFAGSACCGWRLNSAGLVGTPENGWLMAVMSDGWPSESTGIVGNRWLSGVINDHLVPRP